MKTYCRNCESLQPSIFRAERDAATGEPYEDLCCCTCHFVVATVQNRALAQQAEQVPKVWECNQCGSQEFKSNISEQDLEQLSCTSCGGD